MTLTDAGPDRPLVEIGTVARELGVAPGTLRTWERRYHLVVPRRAANGQRLYDTDQVELLRRIHTQIRRGTRAGAAHSAAFSSVVLASTRVELPPTAEAPGLARRAINALDARMGERRSAFTVRLVVAELVSNAVAHGQTDEPIVLEIDLFETHAQVSVAQRGPAPGLMSLRAPRTQPRLGPADRRRARRRVDDRQRTVRYDGHGQARARGLTAFHAARTRVRATRADPSHPSRFDGSRPRSKARTVPTPSLTLEGCRAAFDRSSSYTMGVEEELMLVFPGSYELAPLNETVISSLEAREGSRESSGRPRSRSSRPSARTQPRSSAH